jgi:rhamnose utilization protein RhaD (predicted bifunctional aldolase and dehydrogenase)
MRFAIRGCHAVVGSDGRERFSRAQVAAADSEREGDMIAIPRDSAYESFVALSARLGADSLLVQAAGGNTSVKRDGVLWIKASGKFLRAATRENIFVPVDLAGVRTGIERDEAEPTAGRVLGDTPLRPSIETTLHALLPQRVVLHLHSVNALAYEVREDGQAQVAQRLEGLPWAWVGYRRPGLPLTRVVRAVAGAAISVLALGNHGIVVGADDCDAAEALVRDVERRLALPARAAPPADPARLAAVASAIGYRHPADAVIDALATDVACLAQVRGGVLYPDHVVFLGGEACVIDVPATAAAAIAAHRNRHGALPACVLVAGAGVLVAPGVPAAAVEMLRCQADVLLRVPEGARLRFLSVEEVGELLDWDAEKFRRSAARCRLK